MKLRSEVNAFLCAYWGENSHKLIVNHKLENQNLYTVMYWIFVINYENIKVFMFDY